MKHNLAIIRPAYHLLNMKQYNVQEVGLGKALANKGWNVDFFLYGEKNVRENFYRSQGTAFDVYYMQGVQLLKQQAYYPALFKLLDQKRYDLIQVHEECMLVSALVVKWSHKKDTPAVLYQGMYQPYHGVKRAVQSAFNSWAIPIYRKYLRYSLAKTQAAKMYLQQLGITPVNLLPVGLDTTHLNSKPEIIDYEFQRFSKRFDHTILYLGTLEERRNPLFIVRLLSELSKRLNVGLVMIGKGPAAKATDSLIRESGLQERVFRRDSVPNASVSQYYEEAGLFVLPSNYEIFGMVLLESLYFGVPVVTSDTAGSADIIIDERFGRLLSELDLQSWACVCQEYLLQRRKDKNVLHKHIIDNYRWDFIAERYIRYFEQNYFTR